MIQRQGRVDGWTGQAGDARRLGLLLGAVHISPSIPKTSNQLTRIRAVTGTYRASSAMSWALLSAMAIDTGNVQVVVAMRGRKSNGAGSW